MRFVMKSSFVCVLMAMFGTACSGPSRREELERQVQETLIERASQKSWIDFSEITDPVERRRAIRAAIRSSRTRSSSYLDVVQATGESKAPDPTEEPDATPDRSVTLEFRGAPLHEVIQLIASKLEINVLIPEGLDEPVTASMPNIDARVGLELILEKSGYELSEDGGVFIVTKSDAARLITQSFPLDTGVLIDVDKDLVPLLGAGAIVSADPERRALVITATKEGLERAQQYLDIVDRRPRQVIIEALIVEVAYSDSFRHGSLFTHGGVRLDNDDMLGTIMADFLPSPPNGFSSNPLAMGITNADQAIEFLFSIDETINKLHVVHSPFIAATSGTEAKLKVIETIPYIQATTSIGAGEGGDDGTLTSAESIEFEETGVTLTVTPRIGVDDIVEVMIAPQIDELVEFLNGVPVVDTRESSTTVMVRNEQTIIIGGLLRDSWNHVEVRIPLLWRIPIIGELFKSKELRKDKIELLMFLTPRIIGTGTSDPGTRRAHDHYLNGGRFDGARRIFEDRGTQSSTPRGVRD